MTELRNQGIADANRRRKGIWKLSAEAKQRMSDSKKALVAAGWQPSNTGKKMTYSAEHIEKLRANFRKATAARKFHKLGDTGTDGHGYKWIYAPGHPGVNNQGYVAEHRYIASQILGRPMKKGELVHHLNGNKQDNRHSNLLVCTSSYHQWLHKQMGELFMMAMFGQKEN